MKWKQRLKHAGILTGVFLLAVIIFAYITNRGNDNMTADMGGATYPQVSFSYQGYSLNTLSGYSGSMDIPSMRDTITPIENGKIDLAIEAYENKVTGLKWCVYSLDGTEELLNGEESDPAENVSLEIDPSRLTDREGVLEIVLTTESEEDIYYYTRVTDASGKDILENLNYIQTFHEGALSKDSSAGIESALEPGEESDNSTYQHVTIHSDYDHVTWGNLNPQVEQGERWMIKEINSVSISVEIQFLARAPEGRMRRICIRRRNISGYGMWQTAVPLICWTMTVRWNRSLIPQSRCLAKMGSFWGLRIRIRPIW